MSYIMDTLFGDGTPSQDASDPLATLGRFANTAIAFGAGVAVLGGSSKHGYLQGFLLPRCARTLSLRAAACTTTGHDQAQGHATADCCQSNALHYCLQVGSTDFPVFDAMYHVTCFPVPAIVFGVSLENLRLRNNGSRRHFADSVVYDEHSPRTHFCGSFEKARQARC